MDFVTIRQFDGSPITGRCMTRPLSVDDWKEIEWNSKPDGSWATMMAKVCFP